jgi:glutamate-1-semialdehyde aminotransferase
LIFDECTSGFRESFGGLHLKYKVYPDMLILGKTLGNGYAINAILGKSKIMDTCENTFISSTFWTERIGSAAALETLNQMEKLKSWMIISKKGRLIKKAWKKTFSKHKFKVKISGLDAMPVYNFLDIKSNQIYKTYLIKKMLGKKYLTSNSVYLSISHTDSLIKKYLRDFEKSIKSLRQDIKKNNLNIKNDEISIKSISR